MLELTLSTQNMYAIELTDASIEIKKFLRRELLSNDINSESYKRRVEVNPFLQGDNDSWILIEFWSNDYDKIVSYIDYLNNKFEQEQCFEGDCLNDYFTQDINRNPTLCFKG